MKDIVCLVGQIGDVGAHMVILMRTMRVFAPSFLFAAVCVGNRICI